MRAADATQRVPGDGISDSPMRCAPGVSVAKAVMLSGLGSGRMVWGAPKQPGSGVLLQVGWARATPSTTTVAAHQPPLVVVTPQKPLSPTHSVDLRGTLTGPSQRASQPAPVPPLAK